MVQIFADETVDPTALAACLESPAVQASMQNLVGVIIDPADEAENSTKRKRLRHEGMQVVVRALSGKLIASLRAGYTCEDLETLLAKVSARVRPTRSPILPHSPGEPWCC